MAASPTDATLFFAPAKVNLALHITGQRGDGYHLLDSLVVFPQIGDRLFSGPEPFPPPAASTPAFEVTGPQARSLLDTPAGDNLVVKAFVAYCQAAGCHPPKVTLTLEQHLPVASGIGGGSADAAAALKLAERVTGVSLPVTRLHELALDLGADVPVCIAGKSSRMSGIGEILSPIPTLPAFGVVLVNPCKPVSTPAIFKGLTKRDNPPLPDLPNAFGDLAGLIAYLRDARNDMQATAEALCPEITGVLDALTAEPDCLLARMSGSGATCFALTAPGAQDKSADRLRERHPDWWIASGPVL